ncbi:MAG: hypothetical protein HeimC2_34220 [Candidatus Heimdallarchaeota archaeon LC_2]|nr:MAG: hypothetical protein HeimC2_34220 [Candidatus Heimdallarchaeota archaeon LC_2]
MIYYGLSKKDIDHSGTKSKVLSDINRNDSEVILGMVDEDPHSTKPHEMNAYTVFDSKYNVILLKKSDNVKHKLIQIPGNMEDWLLSQAKYLKVNLNGLGVLDFRGKMKKRFKKHQKEKLYKLFTKLEKSESFMIVKDWIMKYKT